MRQQIFAHEQDPKETAPEITFTLLGFRFNSKWMKLPDKMKIVFENSNFSFFLSFANYSDICNSLLVLHSQPEAIYFTQAKDHVIGT